MDCFDDCGVQCCSKKKGDQQNRDRIKYGENGKCLRRKLVQRSICFGSNNAAHWTLLCYWFMLLSCLQSLHYSDCVVVYYDALLHNDGIFIEVCISKERRTTKNWNWTWDILNWMEYCLASILVQVPFNLVLFSLVTNELKIV